jgi:hypothetical protein
MDKVQKYNSLNTNTPSSESYRNYLSYLLFTCNSNLVSYPKDTVSEKKVLRRIFGPKRDDRENYIISSFIMCTLHKISLE